MIKNILKYYLYSEFFNPSQISIKSPKNNDSDAFEKLELDDEFNLKINEIIADFTQKNEKKLQKGDCELVISIFGLPFFADHINDNKNTLFKALERGSKDISIEKNSNTKQSAFYNISFSFKDGNFMLLENSLVLNASIWALANINSLNLDDYELFLDTREINKFINENLLCPKDDEKNDDLAYILKQINEKFRLEFFKNLKDKIDELCEQNLIYFRLKIQKTTSQNTEMLNSFYASDIFTLLKNIDKKDFAPLVKLLLSHRPNERKDIRTDKNLANSLLKDHQVLSVFAGEFPLRYSQILCVNKYFSSQNDLQSINGAPGTGKTTLLKDIIANIITNRALQIAKLENSDEIFTDKKAKYENDAGGFFWLYELNDALKGYEIVVASSNNGAVENISKEIPRKDSDIFDKLGCDYFSKAASRLIDGDAWGLVCATLGNSKNKSEFKNRVCFRSSKNDTQEDKKVELPSLLDILIDAKDDIEKNKELWQEAKNDFLKALKHTKELIKNTSQVPDFENDEQKELSSVFLTQNGKISELFIAKRKLFIAALKLHEISILANQNKFAGLLNAIKNLFDKEKYYRIENEQKIYLESSQNAQLAIFTGLFFMVPVISSTFASFSRLFNFSTDPFIGNLLIDEAGQATPPAALGALMRAKKCLVVGDPLQLVPVVTIPKNTCELLRAEAGALKDFDLYSTSLQTLADQNEQIGTFIKQDDEQKLWIGSPLRAHNRCLNPMFEISNQTTYNGLMIFAKHGKKPDDRAKIANLESAFIDAASWNGEDDKININEMKLLNDLLDIILPEFSGSIEEKKKYLSIISPFKACAKQAKEQLKFRQEWTDFVQTGTIHTMQGKESKIVIFILGGKKEGARHWAASTPNLLNVAVTRAKECLFMIGIAQNWQKENYFCDALKILPKITLDKHFALDSNAAQSPIITKLKDDFEIDITRFEPSCYEIIDDNKIKFHSFNLNAEIHGGLNIYLGSDNGLKRINEYKFFDATFNANLLTPIILAQTSPKESIQLLKDGKINIVYLLSDFKKAAKKQLKQNEIIFCCFEKEYFLNALNFIRELNANVKINIIASSGYSKLLDDFEKSGISRLQALILILRLDKNDISNASEILEKIKSKQIALNKAPDPSNEVIIALEASKYDENSFVIVK